MLVLVSLSTELGPLARAGVSWGSLLTLMPYVEFYVLDSLLIKDEKY